MKPTRTLLIGIIGFCASQNQAAATDRYWSGNGSNDDITTPENWYLSAAPEVGDTLKFNNTINRKWPYNNKGAGSYFDGIITYSGAGGIKWRGDNTYANKFENNNDSNIFEIEANIGNRSEPDNDLELNPIGTGGVKVMGTVTITGGKQIKVYGDNTLTLAGVVSGSNASLAIQNSGIVILSGSNTYTGNTWSNAGTLVINGDQSLATGDVSVANNGKLAGIGTIGGATTIESDGTYSAGALGAAGNQNFSQTLNLNSNSIFEWDVTTAGADSITASGLNITNNAIFKILEQDISEPFWNEPRSWTVFSGATTGAFSLFNNDGGSFENRRTIAGQGYFDLAQNASGVGLSWTAVPEPTSALAGVLLGAGLLRRRRKIGAAVIQ